MSTRRLWFGILMVAVHLALGATVVAQNDADARVLRLSWVAGDVQVKPSGPGAVWQQAINNMPVTGGSTVWVAHDSTAVIELEDTSTIRVQGPGEIVLSQLSLSADGAPVNRVLVDSGVLYIEAQLAAHADFRVQDLSGKSFVIAVPSQLSFQVENDVASLTVLDGQVRVMGVAGNPVINSGQSFQYSVGPQE